MWSERCMILALYHKQLGVNLFIYSFFLAKKAMFMIPAALDRQHNATFLACFIKI